MASFSNVAQAGVNMLVWMDRTFANQVVKPQTPNPKPQTPNPKPQTPNPKPLTLITFKLNNLTIIYDLLKIIHHYPSYS